MSDKRSSRMTGVPSWRSTADRQRKQSGGGTAYLSMIRERADSGDAEALWWLAECYEDGFHDASGALLVEANPRKAVSLYRRGAALGHVDCMLSLANHLSQGIGTRKNLREALQWEARAARLGSPIAALNAGTSCKHLGDYAAAGLWFRKAAAMGDNGGRLELAKAQLLGTGTRRNIPAAVSLLRRVAASNSASDGEIEEAGLTLAYLYLDGWLVQRSPNDGLAWLRRTEKHGSAVARMVARCFAPEPRAASGK
jgi:TPR repeat protein